MNGPSVALSYLEIGITNVRGYLSLRKQLDRSFGLSVVFGQSKKGPCIYEFKVKSEHDGWLGVFGDMEHTSTFNRVMKPRYLKGLKNNRSYYLPGDIILLRKLQKKHAESFLGHRINDDVPGVLKFFQYIMNDGNPKKYKIGFMILKITSKGDGSGFADLQPVIFHGGHPVAIGYPYMKGTGASGLYGQGNNRDLNYLWYMERTFNGDLNAVVMGFSTFVAEYGVGGAKTIASKAVKKVLGNYAKEKIASEIRQKVLAGLANGSLAFATAFAAEIWQQQEKNLPQDLFRAAKKGMVKFLDSVFGTVAGESLKKLMPEKVVSKISERLARWILKEHAKFVTEMATGLIDINTESRNPKTGKSDKKLEREATEKYASQLASNRLTGIIDEITDAFLEYVSG